MFMEQTHLKRIWHITGFEIFYKQMWKCNYISMTIVSQPYLRVCISNISPCAFNQLWMHSEIMT